MWSVLPDALDMNRDAHDGALEERACCGGLQAWCCCSASCAAFLQWAVEMNARMEAERAEDKRRLKQARLHDGTMYPAENNLPTQAKNRGSAFARVAGAPYGL